MKCDYLSKEYEGYQIDVFYEEDADSPRDFDCNVAKMVCWHNRYNLGDKHDWSEPKDFLASMANKYVPTMKLINYVRKECDYLRVEYNKSDHLWYAEKRTNYWKDTWETLSVRFCSNGMDKDELYDVLLDEMMFDDLIDMLRPYVYIDMLSLYDHSGITMYVGGPCDQWDSGYVGFAYIEKSTALKERIYLCNHKTWQSAAEKAVAAEVKEYDYYLRGEVYGYELLNPEGDEIDSCWGYYGDESIQEVIDGLEADIDELIAA